MAPSANTSRAALQDLASLFDAISQGLGSNDFSVTLAVTAAGAVVEGAATYPPESIQRLTLTPLGSLRVEATDRTAHMTFGGPWQTRRGVHWTGRSPF